MQRGNLRVCKCSSELYYNKYYTVQILWSFLVECVYVIIIIFAIYNYHYYVYAHLQSGQCMFTKSSQRISHSMSAHMCAVWSAHSCSAWPAHIHTAWSVHSLFCAYSRSLVSAQLARQCIFAVWSAHSLVNAFSGSLISVVIVISVCNIRWPFFSKETFCSSECVEFWQAINIIILNANFMRKIGLIFPKVTVKENSLNCYFFSLSVICSCFACSICRKIMTHIGDLIKLVKLISL